MDAMSVSTPDNSLHIPIYQVDAFTSHLFGGNPAAVCPLENWIAADLMQQIAAENNLAETAFTVRTDTGFHIRWFTQEIEMDLCGHATLAAAYVIWQWLRYDQPEIVFTSNAGELRAKSKENGLIELDFPARPPREVELLELVTKSCNHRPLRALAARDLILLFDNEEQIRTVTFQLDNLKQLPYLCIVATAPGRECDFVSRVFDANCVMPEDPVTGSAHCSLAPFWARRLGKNELFARQLSQRGGELFCLVKGDRVLLRGRVVPFMSGEITLPVLTLH